MNKLKHKGVQFEWGLDQDQAFQTLKSKITSSLILLLPFFSKQFMVHSDASGLGCVHTTKIVYKTQDYYIYLMPVIFGPRRLNQLYSTMELKGLAVVFALHKFQPY